MVAETIKIDFRMIEIPTNQLREASMRKHYMFLLKRDIVSKDTVKKFAKDLESLKYCNQINK